MVNAWGEELTKEAWNVAITLAANRARDHICDDCIKSGALCEDLIAEDIEQLKEEG